MSVDLEREGWDTPAAKYLNEQLNALELDRDRLRLALRDVVRTACESGNSITDNAEFWTIDQVRNHAQQTNCEIADRARAVGVVR